MPGITTGPIVSCDIGMPVNWPGGHLDLAGCAGNIPATRPVRLHVGDELTVAIGIADSTTSSAPAVLAKIGSSRTTGDSPVVDHYRALEAGTAVVELTTSYSCLQNAGPSTCAVLDVTVSG